MRLGLSPKTPRLMLVGACWIAKRIANQPLTCVLFSYAFSTWLNSRSTGVERPKMSTETLSRLLS